VPVVPARDHPAGCEGSIPCRRAERRQAGERVPPAWEKTGAGGDASAAEGDRPLRGRVVRERRGAGSDRGSGRPIHRDGPVVGGHDGRAPRGLGRQRRRGARAVDDRQGGPGALAEALAGAARGFGAEIRTSSEVVGISVERHRATGVVLADGSEIPARAVITAIDPKGTLPGLLDPVEIGPHLRWRATNIRTPGSVSKVDFALSGLPSFDGAAPERLAGRIVIAPSIDHLERAFDASKYGGIGDEPFLEATIPTLSASTPAPEGMHVMSVVTQWTPFRLRETDWSAERDRLGDLVVKTLERYTPRPSDPAPPRRGHP